jgi:hypothetical protein
MIALTPLVVAGREAGAVRHCAIMSGVDFVETQPTTGLQSIWFEIAILMLLDRVG